MDNCPSGEDNSGCFSGNKMSSTVVPEAHDALAGEKGSFVS